MPFYETIFETGAVSVAFYENREEALSAIREHHNRAKNGENAIAGSDRPAERIAKVLEYDYHPGEFGVGEEVATDDLKKTLDTKVKELDAVGTAGVVNVPELAAAIRDVTSSHVTERSHRHDSIYKMPEVDQLDPKGWDA